MIAHTINGVHKVLDFYKRIDVKKAACMSRLKFKCPLKFYIYTDAHNVLTSTTFVTAAGLASIFTCPSPAVAAHAFTIVTCDKRKIILNYSYRFITCMLIRYNNLHAIGCNNSNHMFIKGCSIFQLCE